MLFVSALPQSQALSVVATQDVRIRSHCFPCCVREEGNFNSSFNLGENETETPPYYFLLRSSLIWSFLSPEKSERECREIFPSSLVYPLWGLDSAVPGFPSWAFWRECGIGETFTPSGDASVLGELRPVCAGRLPVGQSV